jgi:Fe-S cluster assembly ATP-binding protein
MSFVGSLALFMDPVRRYSKANTKLNQARAAAQRIFALLDEPEEVDAGKVEFKEFKEKIEFKDVTFSYGKGDVIKNLNLVINKGEKVGLVGLSGSGKSTLASVLAGREDYEVTQGEITFEGKDLLDLSPEDRAREGIFLAFQYPVEIPGVSITNFLKTAIAEQREYRGLPPIEAKEFLRMMKEKKELVEISTNLTNRSVNEGFSGGEKKRNEIFQMAMLEPKLSVLDETDSGLDIDALRVVANGVNKLKTPQNASIVITHYQRLLDYIVPDFVHVLYDGRIVKSGGKELALELEEKGYDWITKELVTS